MGKKKDIDTHDLDLDFDGEFDFEDFGDPINSKSNRKASLTSEVAGSGGKSAVVAGAKKITNVLSRELPNTTSTVNTVLTVASDATRLKDEFVRDVTPAINQLKNAGRQLAPKLKPVLPSKYYSKLEKLLEKPDEYKAASVEESRKQSIDLSLASIFEQQRQVESQERQLDNLVDRQLESSRHKEAMAVDAQIRDAIVAQREFTQGVFTAYLRKDLELKYKHLYVAQDTLTIVKDLLKVNSDKLEKIRHNTALPDIQKATAMETYRSIALGNIAQGVNSKIRGWATNVLKKVKEDVLNPISEGIGMAASAADMYAAMDETERSAAEFGDAPSRRSQISSFVGDKIGAFAGTKVGKRLFNKFAPYGHNLESITSNAQTKAALKFMEMQEKANEEDPMSLKSILLNFFSPDISRDAGHISNTLERDPTKPAIYDVATRQSIVEIIPGYLSKILQQATILATGNKNTEELVFDSKKRNFTSASAFKQRVIDDAFGTKAMRGREVGQVVGTLRASYAHHGHTEFSTFDSYNKEIIRVLNNHAVSNLILKPELIKTVADGAPIRDNEYTRMVFSGIERPAEVAGQLVYALYRDNETVNTQVLQNLNDKIINLMGRERYLEAIPVLANALGHARHLSDLFSGDGSNLRFSKEKVLGIFGNVEARDFSSSVANESKWGKRRLDEDIKSKQEMELDGRAKEHLDKLFGNALRTQINDNELPGYNADNLALGTDNSDVINVAPLDSAGGAGGSIGGGGGGNKRSRKGSGGSSGHAKVEIIKSIPLRVELGKGKSGIGSTAVVDVMPVVDAITQFETTFKTYASKQDRSLETLDRIARSTADMSGNFITFLAGNFPNLKDLGKKIKEQGRSLPGTVWDSATRLFKSGIEHGTSVLTGLGGFASGGITGVLNAGRNAFPGIGSAIGTTVGTLAKGYAGAFGAAGGLAGKLLSKPYRWLTGKDRRSEFAMDDFYGNMDESLGNNKSLFQRLKNRFTGKHEQGKAKLDEQRFVDVYKKDMVELGNPLLSVKQQIEGVYFNDGKPVLTSYLITKPVVDPRTQQTLITQQDIEHGLVDVDNKPLKKIDIGLLKDKGREKGNALKDFIKKHPILGMYASMFQMGLDGAKFIGKTASKITNRLFGFDLPGLSKDGDKEGGTSFGISRKDLKKVVGDKLDKIYKFMQKHLSKGTVSGDADGDGDRDGSYKDYIQKKASKAKDWASDKFGAVSKGLASKKSLAAYLAAAGMGAKKKEGDEEEEGGGSFFKDMLMMEGLKKGAGWLKVLGGKGLSLLKGGGRGLLGLAGRALPWAARALPLLSGLGGGAATAATGAGALTAGAGAATAATAAATTATAGAATAGTGMFAGLAAGGSAATSMLMASMASNPIGWIVGGALLTGVAGYAAYNYFSSSPTEKSLEEMRADAYGIDLSKSTGWFSSSYKTRMIELEEVTLQMLLKKRESFNDRDLEIWAEKFEFDPKNKKEVNYFATWYRQRFVPSFRIYMELLDRCGCTYDKVDKLSPDDVEQIKKLFVQSTSSHMVDVANLVPTQEGFKKFSVVLASLDKSKPSPAKTTVAEEKSVEKLEEDKQNAQYTSKSDKYGANPTYNDAARNLGGPIVAGGYAGSSGSSSGGNLGGPIVAGGYAGSSGSSSGGNYSGSYGAGGKKWAGADNNLGTLSIPDSNELGALSAEFESGKNGSGAIGYDPRGGTSYGKYQIASAVGTFGDFLRWLNRQDSDGKEIASVLAKAGPANTMSNAGAVPDAWRELARAGKIAKYEHKFIQDTHFTPALSKLPEPIRKLVSSSKTLADVLWSTAVQHGPGGANSIFSSVYKPDMPIPDFIKTIYAERTKRFPTTASRYAKESKLAQMMISSEGTDVAKAEDQSKMINEGDGYGTTPGGAPSTKEVVAAGGSYNEGSAQSFPEGFTPPPAEQAPGGTDAGTNRSPTANTSAALPAPIVTPGSAGPDTAVSAPLPAPVSTPGAPATAPDGDATDLDPSVWDVVYQKGRTRDGAGRYYATNKVNGSVWSQYAPFKGQGEGEWTRVEGGVPGAKASAPAPKVENTTPPSAPAPKVENTTPPITDVTPPSTSSAAKSEASVYNAPRRAAPSVSPATPTVNTVGGSSDKLAATMEKMVGLLTDIKGILDTSFNGGTVLTEIRDNLKTIGTNQGNQPAGSTSAQPNVQMPTVPGGKINAAPPFSSAAPSINVSKGRSSGSRSTQGLGGN